jgi:amino acid transporter
MTDNVPYSRRNEDAGERLDRQWGELLQELRLAQTGTQILFAFLLGIAFQSAFQSADAFTHHVYAVTLIASALAVGLFLAPVSFHRIVYRHKLRDRMLPIASRMAVAGLAFLVLALTGGVLLATDVVLSRPVAILLTSIVLLWFVVFWYAIPEWVRRSTPSGTGE